MNYKDLIKKLALPEKYSNYISLYLEPLATRIDKQSRYYSTSVIGINGSQGSGKTTSAIILKAILETRYDHRVAILSIDDFYHTKKKRTQLSQTVHPLFVTRGVPGTHDVNLALQTIDKLKTASKNEPVHIPRFDKATDDRRPEHEWDKIQEPVSIIIFEGWCVGAPPLDSKILYEPINNLEKIEDEQGIWRKAINQFLLDEYQLLFKKINWLIMLKAPSFDVVYEWRLLQEKKLAQSLEMEFGSKKNVLNEQQLKIFIEHYQRLTEHCLITIPKIAEAIITLDDQHQMTDLQINKQ
ncbi:MAG: phosphoribulokinase [Gammaproteobacteria bacterium]|nr:phosphoribulokinase [Gammaproteobacteria bacterium]